MKIEDFTTAPEPELGSCKGCYLFLSKGCCTDAHSRDTELLIFRNNLERKFGTCDFKQHIYILKSTKNENH